MPQTLSQPVPHAAARAQPVPHAQRRNAPSAETEPSAGESAESSTAPAQGGLRMSLDWTALQKALVFTKLVYRKPQIDKLKKPPRPPVPSTEAIAAVAAASIGAARGVSASPAEDPSASPTRFVDAFGETDERLLPWSCD